MPEYRKVKLSDLSRRELMKMASSAAVVTSSVGLAGCIGGGGGGGGGDGGGGGNGGGGSDGGSGGGGGGGGGSSDFQSAVSNIDFKGNWRERRGHANPMENWPMEKRLSEVPTSDLGASDSWLGTETVSSAVWEPPSGWEDTAASEVEEIEILNYGDMQFDRATAATDALMEDRTGIKMTRIQVVVDQAIPKAAAFLSSKQKTPHMLLSTTYSSMSTYASNGWLEPVDFMHQGEMWDVHLPIAKQSYQWNGTQWGGPNIIEGKVVHLRPKLIRDQGVSDDVVDSILDGEYSWSELETVMEAFKGTDVAGWGYRGSSLTYTENDWREMWYQAGGQYATSDGKITVDTEAGLYALERMIQWREDGLVPEAVTTWTQGDLADGFLSGSLAMVPVATDLIADSVEQFGKGEEYQIARPPKADSGAPDPKHRTLATTTVSAINTFTDLPHKLAGTLFQDCRSTYASSWWEYVEEGNMSITKSVYDDAADQATFSQQKGRAMETAKNEVFPQQRAINQEVSEQLQLAVAGDKEPKKALEDAQSFIDTVLSQ